MPTEATRYLGADIPRISNAGLLRRRGRSFWTPDFAVMNDDDHRQNHESAGTLLTISDPNPQSTTLSEKLFSRVSDVHLRVFRQTHKLDLFTIEMFDVEDSQVNNWAARYGYSREIELLMLAQRSGNQDSAEALTILHNIARKGGKIAFVLSHGLTENGTWNVYSRAGEATSINEVARDLASRSNADGTQTYQAIYFAACNDSNAAPDMSGIAIPVLVHTEINEDESVKAGYVKTYFPEEK